MRASGGRRLAEVRFGLLPQVLPVIAGPDPLFHRIQHALGDHHRRRRRRRHRAASVRADPRARMAAGVVPDPADPDLGRRDRLRFRPPARGHGRPQVAARLTLTQNCHRTGSQRRHAIPVEVPIPKPRRAGARWASCARAVERTRRAPRAALARSSRARSEAGRDRPRDAARPRGRRRRAVQSRRGDGHARDRRIALAASAVMATSSAATPSGRGSAAILDALWQRAESRAERGGQRAGAGRGAAGGRARKSDAETAATRVDFFTLVRGEDERMSALAFADPVFESQAAFRAILRAMASPGADRRLRARPQAAAAAQPRRGGGAADACRFRDAAVDRARRSPARRGRGLSQVPYRRPARRRARQGGFRAGRRERGRPRSQPSFAQGNAGIS